MDARQTAAIVKLKPKYVDLTEANLDMYESQDGMFLTTTIKVENMTNLRDARNALNRIVSGQNIGNVTEVPAARSFVVTDFAPNVVAIYRLLKEMDVQPEGKVVKSAYIQLEYATADEIEPVLQDLFTGREAVSRGPRPGGGNQASADIEADPEPRIISDFRTNQLIIYATADDIAEIKEVVAKLDIAVFLPNTWVHVIPLKNLDAQETAEVLQSLIEQSTFFGLGAGGVGRRQQPADARAARPHRRHHGDAARRRGGEARRRRRHRQQQPPDLRQPAPVRGAQAHRRGDRRQEAPGADRGGAPRALARRQLPRRVRAGPGRRQRSSRTTTPSAASASPPSV